MIELKATGYRYPNGRVALAGVNLRVRPGEIVVVVGRNGSGKSTLGNVVAGLYRAKGEVRLDGVKYGKIASRELRGRVGVVFQNPDSQIVFTSVREDVNFMLKNLGVAEAEWGERVAESLARVGMEGREEMDPHEMSYGQKQRVAIAGMLAARPEYMVLDEPTAMVDSEGRERIREVMREMRAAGMGVVLITNDIDEIGLGDRVVFLREGEVFREVRGGREREIIRVLRELGFQLSFYWRVVEAGLRDAAVRKVFRRLL